MSDEERAELEAMRTREAQWEAHLEEQEARMADAQSALWQQRRERDDMAAEWQAMKAQVRAMLRPALSSCLLVAAIINWPHLHRGG